MVTGLVLEVVYICVLESDICNALRCENHGSLTKGYTDPGCHVVMATEVFTVAPDICEPSVWKLLHSALLEPRILRQFLDFWKMCGPFILMYL
jgi:hypothetical protein